MGEGEGVECCLVVIQESHSTERPQRRTIEQEEREATGPWDFAPCQSAFCHARFAQLTSSLKNSVFVTFVIFVYCELFRFVMREALDDLGLFSQFGDELFYAVYPNASFSWLWGFDFLNF